MTLEDEQCGCEADAPKLNRDAYWMYGHKEWCKIKDITSIADFVNKVDAMEYRIKIVRALRNLKIDKSYRELGELLGVHLVEARRYVVGEFIPKLKRCIEFEKILKREGFWEYE